MWASVVISQKSQEKITCAGFTIPRDSVDDTLYKKIKSRFLTELPRFQSKPLPSMPSANSAAIKPGYIFLEVPGRMLSTNPTEQERTISEDTRDKLFPQNLLSRYRCRSIFWTWPPRDPKWENKVSENFLLGSFSNESVKKAISLLRKTTTLHVYHAFFGTFLRRHCTTTTWHYLTWRFMEDVKKRRRIFLLFLNFSAVPKKSTPGKFAYIWQFQQIGINATKFEKTRIHFKINVFTTLVVGDAKNKVDGWSFKIVLGGCLAFRKSFWKIKRIESKWNTTFRVVSVENFREQRKVWFRVPFLQSHLWYKFQPFAAVFGNVTD